MPTGSHLYPIVTFPLVLQPLKPTFVPQLTLLFHNLIRLIYGQSQRFQERGIGRHQRLRRQHAAHRPGHRA